MNANGHKKLHTVVCDMLDIEYPIMMPGMGHEPGGVKEISTPKLAAAVSNAGGLGVLGCALLETEDVSERIRAMKKLTSKPFGVNLGFPSGAPEAGTVDELRAQLPAEYVAFMNKLKLKFNIPDSKRVMKPYWSVLTDEICKRKLEIALDEGVPVLACALGTPKYAVDAAHARKVKIISQIGSVRQAQRVAQIGADIVVATGYEGGAHGGETGLSALVPRVVDAVHPVPVLAAGGIVDGRGLVAALSLGASGVWCGTAFLASQEYENDWHRRAITQSTGTDTVKTKYFSGKLHRHLRTPLDDAWASSGLAPLPMPLQGMLIWDFLEGAAQAGMPQHLRTGMGQGAGLVKEVKPVKEIIEGMVTTAIEVYESLGTNFVNRGKA